MTLLALLCSTAIAACPMLAIAAQPAKTALPPPDIDAKGVQKTSAPNPDQESMKPAMPDTRPVRDKA